MAVYLIQLGYSAEAVRAMVKTPQSREETARAAVESVGGKLHSFHFAFGEFDAVMIAEVPNNASALATALAATAGGSMSKFHTTPLMTAAESVEAMKLAQKVVYAPPK